ncbi:MAG TPA: hypothetical protein VMQ93_20435 [Novosphingobium sp.]|nr:hypothetical protein [Novosphingobium sp.]
MVRWHETLGARIGLRVVGAGLLLGAAAAVLRLHRAVHAQGVHGETAAELGLCLLAVACLLAGNALLIVGPGLWARVSVPGRWFPEPTARRGRSGR